VAKCEMICSAELGLHGESRLYAVRTRWEGKTVARHTQRGCAIEVLKSPR
jgi:hypothetical protein